MSNCPCGSAAPIEACCGPFLEGSARPDTAEQLMRSRYSAYALEDFDYIRRTWHPDFRADLSEDWPAVEWLGLTIEETESGGPDDDQGMVQFQARYRGGQGEQLMRERSLFRKEQGLWYYTQAAPLQARSGKVGRNEPCPCGSGRKFKKCCGR